MKIDSENNLIFVGNLHNKFDEKNLPLDLSARLKFVMLIGLTGSLQMLLMEEYEPFSYHAQAILSYMKENNLDKITLNGGGKLTFEDKRFSFNGFSYAFDGANNEEVRAFAEKIWPDQSIEVSLGRQLEGPIDKTGTQYLLGKIQHFVDNP